MDLETFKELKRYENYLKTFCNTSINKYVYQSELIKNDVQFFVKSANLQDRLYAYHDLSDYNSIRDYVAITFGVSSILESIRINNAYSHRVCRLRSRVSLILQRPCLFLTLTFTDDVLKKTNSTSRRKYVQRFLKSYSDSYVANIDFGEEKGREHYHALINCESILYSDWSYGSINFERVSIISDVHILSKYIAKLTNHSIKESTKRSSLIYPKNVRG